jgi:putative membrane protein insertion efficiency factor
MPRFCNRLKVLPGLLFLVLVVPLRAQEMNVPADLTLISERSSQVSVHDHRDFLFHDSKSILKKYNPLTLIAGSLLYTYQNLISQQLSASCLYHPSCSAFGKEAIEKYGFIKGFFLAADRVNRCNRISGMDIHPLRVDPHLHRASDPVEAYH